MFDRLKGEKIMMQSRRNVRKNSIALGRKASVPAVFCAVLVTAIMLQHIASVEPGSEETAGPAFAARNMVFAGEENDGPDERPVHEVPAEIPADLSEDVTPQLQEFIDSVPDGALIVFPEEAEYLIEGTLTLSDRHDLAIEGNGALFRSKDKVTTGGRLDIRNRAHWRVNNDSSNIVIRNVAVRGPNDAGGLSDEAWDASREAQHAFDIDGASNVTLEGVRASYVFGDGAYIRSDHVVLRQSRIHNIGRQGVAVANCEDVLIEENDIRDVRRGIFNVEQYGAGWASDNVRILNNTTGRSRLLWMPISGSGVAGSVLVAGNVMAARTGIPVITNIARESGRRGPFVAVDNHFVVGGSPQAAFRLQGIDGLLFAGNSATFPARREMTAVRADDSKGGIITSNVFEDAAKKTHFNEETDAYAGANQERGEVELVELDGGYAADIRSKEGRTIAVWRMGESEEEKLAAFDLETDAVMAILHLDVDGEPVRHYIIGDGSATFAGETL